MFTANLYYYLKAVLAGLSSGVLYLSSFLGSDFGFDAFAHVSVGHWLGLVLAVFGIGGLTAVVTNGSKPVTAQAKNEALLNKAVIIPSPMAGGPHPQAEGGAVTAGTAASPHELQAPGIVSG